MLDAGFGYTRDAQTGEGRYAILLPLSGHGASNVDVILEDHTGNAALRFPDGWRVRIGALPAALKAHFASTGRVLCIETGDNGEQIPYFATA